jgi:hypothetical protein
MARSKQYSEQEVIEKDVLFMQCIKIISACWKEMGINQFSIYASKFWNKHYVFLELEML